MPHTKTFRQLGDLSIDAPFVIGHRLTRLALAGPNPSDQDRQEFLGMMLEKQLAMTESWVAMWAEIASVQQSMWRAWLGGSSSWWVTLATPHLTAQRVLNEGLSPYHRKAGDNARRLAGTPLLQSK